MSEYIFKRSNSLLNNLISSISNIFSKSNDSDAIYIDLPSDILHRTQLICDYIQKEDKCDFGVEEFILLIYIDFIKDCVENYNPKKTLKILTTKYYDKHFITLTNGTDSTVVESTHVPLNKLRIEFTNEDRADGELILRELYDLYHYKITFEKMIEQIWLKFITDYKNGNNKKAFKNLEKMIERYWNTEDDNDEEE